MIEELNDQEKSVLLAKAMGWKAGAVRRNHTMFHAPIQDKNGAAIGNKIYPVVMYEDGTYYHNLYDPANMALAWRALNWAMDEKPSSLPLFEGQELFRWWNDRSTSLNFNLMSKSPADAQRLWLDKILELCIEAEIESHLSVLTGDE